jgi:hypothetical protein
MLVGHLTETYQIMNGTERFKGATGHLHLTACAAFRAVAEPRNLLTRRD